MQKQDDTKPDPRPGVLDELNASKKDKRFIKPGTVEALESDLETLKSLKLKVSDEAAGALLKKPRRAKKAPEGYHLAKVTHAQVDPSGQLVIGVHYIDGIRPSDPEVPAPVKYHLPSMRSGPVKGHPRGLKLVFEDGTPMVQRLPAGPYDGEKTRAARRNWRQAIRRMIRQTQRANRWKLAA